MAYHFKNLVFEGGGVKGIAYLGALKVLEDKKRKILPNIERVGGTSAGAINALLLGLDYKHHEMKKILWSLDFNKFMDDSSVSAFNIHRLVNNYGWHKGDYFRNWIADLIAQRTGNRESTFADIEAMKDSKGFKSLYFVGTNLSTSFSEVFSAEHTPRVCIADAVRISMSIPLVFAAERGTRGDVYVDGGVLNNYPIKLFDRDKYLIGSSNFKKTSYYDTINRQVKRQMKDRSVSEYVYNEETLGFRLDTKEEIAMFRDHAEPTRRTINNFFDYVRAFAYTILEAQQSMHLHSDDWNRTIYIDTLGVNTTDFDLSDANKRALIKSGKTGTAEYFAWYDKDMLGNPVSKPSSKRKIPTSKKST